LASYIAGANKFNDIMVLCLSWGNGNNSQYPATGL